MRTTDPEVREREHTGGSGIGIVVGILLVIIGLAAIARPVYATIASTIAFGWIFIFAGIAQFIYAFGSRGAGQFVWMLLSIFYFGAGIVILTKYSVKSDRPNTHTRNYHLYSRCVASFYCI